MLNELILDEYILSIDNKYEVFESYETVKDTKIRKKLDNVIKEKEKIYENYYIEEI